MGIRNFAIIIYMEITIATWNIAGGHTIHDENEQFAYNPEDIAYFINELKDLAPDIICLQETHLNNERSIAHEIAGELGGLFCFEQDNSPSHIDPEYRLGNAVLSKYSFKKKGNFTLPNPNFPLKLPNEQERHNKGFQVVEFDFGSLVNIQMLPLSFLGTPYDSDDGKTFAKEMEDYMNLECASAHIICGDFNYKAASDLYSNLLSGMIDTLPKAPTRPGEKKTDYIFCRNEIKVLDAGIINTKTDHYLCWTKIGI
jgi:endonuclease/exonuclease/phosphatase family metal-dependent hydrolase